MSKYPKVKSSSLSLNFFKDYAKTIKEHCKESGDQFKRVFTWDPKWNLPEIKFSPTVKKNSV